MNDIFVKEGFVHFSGGRIAIDKDGYVSLPSGKMRHEAFIERLRCSRIADAYAAEMGPGPHRYAGNIISSRILRGS